MQKIFIQVLCLSLVAITGCNPPGTPSGSPSGTPTPTSTPSNGYNPDAAGALDWEEAISFCESLNFAGRTDWRLPNVKELHTLVDYSRSPETSNSAAIDPIFNVSSITNEGGVIDYPFYWSSTTHLSDIGATQQKSAAYIVFGRALGKMQGSWLDVHGAGAQRSDPKADDGTDYSEGRGPQGDAVRINNFVRCTRDDTSVTNPGYNVVDTSQVDSTTASFGEDADYSGNQANYADNLNGTITDNIAGLIWQRDPGAKMSYANAVSGASGFLLAGYSDWRLPSIKELYSLILFSGEDPNSCTGTDDNCASEKFIDESYFIQPYGETDEGYRVIDAQTWTATEYVSTTMNGDDTVFGVNFIDGRIKGYPKTNPQSHGANILYTRYVRGNPTYDDNNFINNNDDTITDLSTGLMWTRDDSGLLISN